MSEYDKLTGAFGRSPIVIHLADFLQLKPTATNISLNSGHGNGCESVVDCEETKHYGTHIMAACDFMAILCGEDSSSTALRQSSLQVNGFTASMIRTRHVRPGGKPRGYSTCLSRELAETVGQSAVSLKGGAQHMRWSSNVIIGLNDDEVTQPVTMVPDLRKELVGWRRDVVRPEPLAMLSAEVARGHFFLPALGAILAGLGAVEFQGRGCLGALRVFGAIPVALGVVEFQGRGSLHQHTLLWTTQAQSIGVYKPKNNYKSLPLPADVAELLDSKTFEALC